MSKANPRKAMAALLPCPIKVGNDLVVKPMTLAMYAALERIGSPLVTNVDAKDTIELIPSLYLITHGAEEIFRGNILDLAMAWADTVPVTVMRGIREACERQLQTVRDVIPEQDPKKATASAETTAGSPRSSTTSPAPITGPSARSCGRLPSPLSHSFAARKTCATSSARSSRSQKSRK